MSIATELAAIRTDAVAIALPDTATVGRYSITDDGAGGHIESWTSGGTMQIRINQIRSRLDVNLGERLESVTDAVHITYPYAATLNERDRLTVGGRTFSIEDVLDNGSWDIFHTAYAVQIQ